MIEINMYRLSEEAREGLDILVVLGAWPFALAFCLFSLLVFCPFVLVSRMARKLGVK